MSETRMQYRKLGRSGLKVSAVSLGGWTTYGQTVEEQNVVQRIIDRALELGVNFFDIADVYARGKAEELMGAALAASGAQRHHLVVSSKVFHPMSDDVNDRGLSRKHIMESIDRSLDRLGFDYLDVYFAHRYDPETPLEETVEAFSDVVRSGRAHYWGTSMWTAAQIAEAHTFAKANGLVAPVTEQPEYSMIRRGRVGADPPHHHTTRDRARGIQPPGAGAAYRQVRRRRAAGQPLRQLRTLPREEPDGSQRRQGQGAQARGRRAGHHAGAARPRVGPAAAGGGERHHGRQPPGAAGGQRQGRQRGAEPGDGRTDRRDPELSWTGLPARAPLQRGAGGGSQVRAGGP